MATSNSQGKIRLGVVMTHPVQYYAPLFRELSICPSVDLTVYYCHRPSASQQGSGYGVPFKWDRDLLSGYRHVWMRNIAMKPTVDSFWGCNTPEIAGRILRGEMDVTWVQGWNTLSFWQAMTACWCSRTPVVVRGDSHLHVPAATPWKRGLKDLLYPLFIRRLDACLAVGAWSEEYFLHYGAVHVPRVTHCVDTPWFVTRARAERERRAERRQTWNISEDALVFLFAGRFQPVKRPLDILRAAAQLRTTATRRFHVLMVGDGPLRQECEAYAGREGIPVTFTGFLNQSDLPVAYAAADCLILPSGFGSPPETWGLVVNEGMASGLPAIVSDQVGCGPDMVQTGLTGFRFPAGDIEALAACMQQFVDDRRLAGQMGAEAERRSSDYTPAAVAAALVEAVDEVWRRKHPHLP